MTERHLALLVVAISTADEWVYSPEPWHAISSAFVTRVTALHAGRNVERRQNERGAPRSQVVQGEKEKRAKKPD